MVWLLIGVGAVFVALISAHVYVDARRRRAFWAELANREPMSDEELVSRFFSDTNVSVNVVGPVRRAFGDFFGYPVEKLRPDDDLNIDDWEGIDTGPLVEELQSTFHVTFTDLELERTQCTIRAVSLLLVEKIGQS